MMTGKSEASKQDDDVPAEKQNLPEKRHVKKYAKKIVLPNK